MRSGEEGAWAEVLNSVGDLGEWSEQRALASFEGGDRVWRNSVHLVWFGHEVVGTTCVQLHDGWPDLPELGWVAVAPAHQKKGLGRAVCLAVLAFMREQGYERCYLTTDDPRLPAIKSYLGMGFSPALEHESHPERWATVCEGLGLDCGTVTGLG